MNLLISFHFDFPYFLRPLKKANRSSFVQRPCFGVFSLPMETTGLSLFLFIGSEYFVLRFGAIINLELDRLICLLYGVNILGKLDLSDENVWTRQMRMFH